MKGRQKPILKHLKVNAVTSQENTNIYTHQMLAPLRLILTLLKLSPFISFSAALPWKTGGFQVARIVFLSFSVFHLMPPFEKIYFVLHILSSQRYSVI